jgi:hypothetical protein
MTVSEIIGAIPYRLALAGGWIDQPFVSKHNPNPPGSMVVISLVPTFPIMDRCGVATSTRKVAMELWKGKLPAGNPAELVKELFKAENEGKPYISGSQDMIGIVYPGIHRLDYDFSHEGGVFPKHIETNTDPVVRQANLWFVFSGPSFPEQTMRSPSGSSPSSTWFRTGPARPDTTRFSKRTSIQLGFPALANPAKTVSPRLFRKMPSVSVPL